MAYLELESEECSGCSLPMSETLDPANERKYQATAYICHACAARTMHAQDFNEGASEYAKAGAVFAVELND